MTAPSTPNTPDSPETGSTDPTAVSGSTFTRRRQVLGIGVIAAAVLSVSVVTTVHTGSTPHHGGQPSNAASSTSPREADRRTSASATPKGSDHTGTAHTEATRALSDWAASNPAASGGHGVGASNLSGPGGSIREVIRISALGADWAEPVYEGVGDQQLRAGVGHFPGTELPGQIGNFAIAGHRSGVADPAFRNIDNIKPGSTITVTTADRITYTYTVTHTTTVDPTDVNVLAAVPGQPNATPTTAELTLITCWPAYGHTKRVVVEAQLTSSKGGA